MFPSFLVELKTMSSCPHSVASLLPHAPPMVLLDEVVDQAECEVSAAVLIHPDSVFFVEDKGVPSYVGLEYMAQTCGVFAGLECLDKRQPVKLGFLLGTRNFHTSVAWFKSGERLIITIHEIFRQDTMGVFDCRINCAETEVASAQLNVYQPEEPLSMNASL